MLYPLKIHLGSHEAAILKIMPTVHVVVQFRPAIRRHRRHLLYQWVEMDAIPVAVKVRPGK